MPRERLKRLGFRVAIGVLMTLAAVTIVSLGTTMYGRVSGEEFAPDTFERRTYSYFEVPLLRFKVTSTKQTTSTPELARTLTDKGYIATTSPPTRWDLVFADRNGKKWREGDARILCQYLDTAHGEGNPFWLHWTNKHASLAGLFWPEISKLARRDLYLLVPELFRVAATAQDPQTFRRDLNRVLARSYEQLAWTESQLQHHDVAVEFFTEALTYDPDRSESLRGRAACYDALGKASDATRDRHRARAKDQEQTP